MVLAVDELDPAALSDLLCTSEVTGGARVLEIVRRTVGSGQVASCVELTLRLEDGHEAVVVAKVPSDDPTSVATAAAQRLYEREVRFYAALAPTVAIRVPACLHASFDAQSGRFLLLLESLSPAAQVDQLVGLDTDRAARALEQLAGLHAPHWGAPPSTITAFLDEVATSLRPLYLEIVPLLFGTFLERYGDRLSAEARHVVEWLRPRLGTYMDTRDGPPTVTHGDFRTDNLLFEGRGGEVPVAAVDWQTIGVGPGALDAGYLLATSLERDVREREERQLLEVYHGALRALGVEDYALADLRDDVTSSIFYGVVMLVCAAVIVEQTDRGDAMFLAMIERLAGAVEDYGAMRRRP